MLCPFHGPNGLWSAHIELTGKEGGIQAKAWQFSGAHFAPSAFLLRKPTARGGCAGGVVGGAAQTDEAAPFAREILYHATAKPGKPGDAKSCV